MDDEVLIARVYIHEADYGKRKSLMQEVLNILHDQQRVQGVVVFRAIAGFGDSGEVHASDALRLNVDLPLVIEFFDVRAVVEAALALLTPLVPPGHILHWPTTRHGGPPSGPPGKRGGA
jgi:PII-like signaling protein